MWIWLIVLCGVLALVGVVIQRRVANPETGKRLSQEGEGTEDGSTAPKRDNPGERESSVVTATKDGGWIINPESAFRLTLYGIDQATALHIKHLLDATGAEWSTAAKVDALLPVIVRSHLRCKEIEAYISEFRPVYLKTLADLQRASPEWARATEQERKDLLAAFRAQALAALDIRPQGDLVALFEETPSDTAIDEALYERLGFELLQVYMRHAEPPEKISLIPRKHPDRAGFERLADLGLALRGPQIPLHAIVGTLKLKEIKAAIADLNPPPLTRKSQAIPHLLALPDAKARVVRAVPLEDYFQLSPLPPELAHLDLHRAASAWRYVREVAALLVETYTRGYDVIEQKQHYLAHEAEMSGWKIGTAAEACPYCKRSAERIYPLSQAPRIPLHLGCQCQLLPHDPQTAKPVYAVHAAGTV